MENGKWKIENGKWKIIFKMYLIELFYKGLYNQFKKNGAEPVAFTCLMIAFTFTIFIMNISV